MMFIEVKDSNFREHVSDGVCLVIFYKDPCPYCMTMKAVLEKFKLKNPDVKLLQINGLENTKTAIELHVSGFPDIVFYKNGQLTPVRQKGLTNVKGLITLYQTVLKLKTAGNENP
jgi:thiol-disulfide isomerase/thioredoxin